jgi:hypothetical protein
MAKSFFPIHLPAVERGSTAFNDRDFQALFDQHRRKDQSYYAYDVIVKSPTTVEFSVRDMISCSQGGIGRELYSFELHDVDEDITAPAIKRHATQMAQQVRDWELRREEERRIADYAATIEHAARWAK